MKKTMLEITVKTNDGRIEISQPTGQGRDVPIWVSPDQVDALVAWLNEAKAELLPKAK